MIMRWLIFQSRSRETRVRDLPAKIEELLKERQQRLQAAQNAGGPAEQAALLNNDDAEPITVLSIRHQIAVLEQCKSALDKLSKGTFTDDDLLALKYYRTEEYRKQRVTIYKTDQGENKKVTWFEPRQPVMVLSETLAIIGSQPTQSVSAAPSDIYNSFGH